LKVLVSGLSSEREIVLESGDAYRHTGVVYRSQSDPNIEEAL
jgi:hypothetical protein